MTSIIVTNKNYIYQGGVVVLFETKNRDLRRGVVLFDETRTKNRDQERESSVYY